MKSLEEKQLKKIERQIWWMEIKVGWLRFMIGKPEFSQFRFVSIMYYFLIFIPLYFIYLVIDDFYILEKSSSIFVIILLFFLACVLGIILDKKIFRKIEFMDQRLSSFYKRKFDLIEIINNKKS